MSTENTTYAFQNVATIGVGLTQFWLESRITHLALQATVQCQPEW
jgi:hypothetical protein